MNCRVSLRAQERSAQQRKAGLPFAACMTWGSKAGADREPSVFLSREGLKQRAVRAKIRTASLLRIGAGVTGQ